MNVLITGGAGQIAYALIPIILSGQIFGVKQTINLKLLDIESSIERLHGVKMEIEDSNFTCTGSLTITSNIETAFTDINLAILLGGFPRSKDMSRNDLISKNFNIFKQHGEALNKYSSSDVKVLVVANPANTNCWTANYFAPRIPSDNFTSLSYLDQERLRFLLQDKYNIPPLDIKNIVIWGNHSDTMVPDISYLGDTTEISANLPTHNSDVNGVKSSVHDKRLNLDDHDIKYIQDRGKNIISKRGLSSALSAASAIQKHLQAWYHGSNDEIISFGVYNKQCAFGFPSDLVISLPVKTYPNFKICIQDNLHIQNHVRKLIMLSIEELQNEYKEIYLSL